MSTLYETRPGGTIVRLADGTATTVAYGQSYTGQLDPGKLHEAYVDGLSSHTDQTPRLSAEDANLALARDAHQRAALADNGQVNSGQSPVPANYGELTEDAAAILVMNLERFPEQQASILFHEILFGGNRRKVIDAGSEYAHIAAQSRIAALMPTQKAEDVGRTATATPVTSPGDPGIGLDAAGNARYAAAAAAALGLEAIKAGTPEEGAPPASLEPAFAGGPETEADKGRSAALEARLSERDETIEALQAQLEALSARIEANSSNPAQSLAPGETGIPANRTTDPDGGDASGFDGQSGVGSEGYWSNSDLNKYADQHDVPDYPASGNRQERLAALRAAGHEAPQTPKP